MVEANSAHDRRGFALLAARTRSEAVLYDLPGRTWGLILGPENPPVKNTTLGLAVYPLGSGPPSYTRETQEEGFSFSLGEDR